MNKISVIIPVLNEADNILNLLTHLKDNATRKNLAEIIVVDGGSTDSSQDIVNRIIANYSDLFKQIYSKKGRAKQMNAGAQEATGNILYFLHADSFPPKNYDRLIINEIKKGNAAGCFKMQFNHRHWWLYLVSWFTQFSWRACRGGDQSQFVTKQLFNEIGGFDERFIIYEDNDFINKLYARKEFTVIQETLISSSRAYIKNGIWKLQYHFLMIYIKKWFGASAEELHSYYKQHITT